MSTHMDGLVRSAHERLLGLTDASLVFRRRDLIAAGIPDALQSAMLRRGLLVRLRHGVYVSAVQVVHASAADFHRIHLAAAIAATDESTWAFGASAAVVHGLPLPFDAPDCIDLLRQEHQDERSLTRPSRHRLELPRTRVTTHRMTEADVTTVNGIPVVGPPLAAISVARQLSHRWQVAAFDAVLWNRTATEEDLYRLSEEWRSRGGKATIDEAIARARRGAQTVLETMSRLALVDQGLPEPSLQVPFYDRAGLIGYVDMYWPDFRVIGEADGRVKYAERDDLVREKIREDRLRALGFRVVRWMWQDVYERPAEVARWIRDARQISA